jgi:hypothetical protein
MHILTTAEVPCLLSYLHLYFHDCTDFVEYLHCGPPYCCLLELKAIGGVQISEGAMVPSLHKRPKTYFHQVRSVATDEVDL